MPGTVLQLEDFLRRHVADEIELAGREPLRADDRAGDVAEHDAVEIGLAGFPVVRIALDRDLAALAPIP